MGKKENGFLVLMAFIIDIFVGYSWYVALFPTEVATHVDAILTGAGLMFFSLLVLALNIMVYLVAVSEGS